MFQFDELPIHKMIYYQSYNNVTVDQLNNATDIRYSKRRSKLNPSGSRQDCLGMTPLHILACSSIQSVELYRVLVDKYPETLVTEDRWGAVPLLYAVWGQAPDDIVQFLIDSYKSVYPDKVLNWTKMIQTLGIAGAPLGAIQSLLDVQKHSFSSQQHLEWKIIIDNLIQAPSPASTNGDSTRTEMIRFLVQCSFAERIDAIGFRSFRNNMMEIINTTPMGNSKQNWFSGVKSNLCQYETKFQNLKEATSVLELVLWKNNISEANSSDDVRGSRKRKFDEPGSRKQCRVSCGADIIIGNVLPYLLPS